MQWTKAKGFKMLLEDRLWKETLVPVGLAEEMVRLHTPSFFPEATLVRRARSPNPIDDAVLFVSDGVVAELNGNSGVVHALRRSESLRVTSKNVVAYLTFFCSFVGGENRRFWILDPDGDHAKRLPPQVRIKLKSSEKSELSRSSWRVVSDVHYGAEIWRCTFLVQRNGEVQMIDDRAVIESPTVQALA
ncbi:MAG: hypothetical protein NXH97_23630 [Rhodobacteraceae bacterium]|nr:hypothetical protein [Paracoccaceae bacterium]